MTFITFVTVVTLNRPFFCFIFKQTSQISLYESSQVGPLAARISLNLFIKGLIYFQCLCFHNVVNNNLVNISCLFLYKPDIPHDLSELLGQRQALHRK